MGARLIVVPLLGLVVLLMAACGGEAGQSSGDDAAEAADDNGDDNGIGSGDPDASSVTFDGEERDVHSVICAEVAVEDDALRVLADVGDTEEALGVAVNERTDGAHVRITRGDGDPDFHGHSWYTPSGSEDAAEIDVDGARGELELRWDSSSGNDEPEDSDAKDIAFDLVCS